VTHLLTFIRALVRGTWDCGFDRYYPGFVCRHEYYDGDHYCLQVWRFWVSLSY
jgi:hypothetical protein